VLIVLGSTIVIVAPFLLAQLGWMASGYDVRDGMLVLLPRLHAFPRAGAFLTIMLTTIGAMAATVSGHDDLQVAARLQEPATLRA